MEQKNTQFENVEMVSDIEFISNDLANIELEIMEHQEAIKTLNDAINNKLKQKPMV